MQISVKKSLTRLILTPTIILTIFLVASLMAVVSLMELNDNALDSLNATSKIHELKGAIADMESGLRGYIVSRNDSFLDPYFQGRPRAETLFNELKRDFAKLPDESKKLSELYELMGDWLVYAEKMQAEARRLPATRPPEDFLNFVGKAKMDKMRLVIAEILSYQYHAFAERSHTTKLAVTVTVVATLLIALVLGLFLVSYIRREVLSLAGAFEENVQRAEKAVAEYEKLNADLENKVNERTSDLRATNAELESFCYSVSHDLRAPLRGIDGFSQALIEDYGDNFPEQGKKYLQFVRQGIQKMGNLIDDLLNLSRLSRAELKMESVDLSAIAREVAEDLSHLDPKRQWRFECYPSEPAYGDKGLLKAVVTNLVSNAWKFTAKSANAKVEFGSLPMDGEIVYFVKDNGAGFDMAYYDKLFGAFQRLHSAKEFEGNGIGLATVRRIVRKHGGEVWGEGKVGGGATFYFSLAKSTQGLET